MSTAYPKQSAKRQNSHRLFLEKETQNRSRAPRLLFSQLSAPQRLCGKINRIILAQRRRGRQLEKRPSGNLGGGVVFQHNSPDLPHDWEYLSPGIIS